MASIFGLSDKNSFQMTQNNSVLRISRESNFIVHTQHPSTECNFLPDRFFFLLPYTPINLSMHEQWGFSCNFLRCARFFFIIHLLSKIWRRWNTYKENIHSISVAWKVMEPSVDCILQCVRVKRVQL